MTLEYHLFMIYNMDRLSQWLRDIHRVKRYLRIAIVTWLLASLSYASKWQDTLAIHTQKELYTTLIIPWAHTTITWSSIDYESLKTHRTYIVEHLISWYTDFIEQNPNHAINESLKQAIRKLENISIVIDKTKHSALQQANWIYDNGVIYINHALSMSTILFTLMHELCHVGDVDKATSNIAKYQKLPREKWIKDFVNNYNTYQDIEKVDRLDNVYSKLYTTYTSIDSLHIARDTALTHQYILANKTQIADILIESIHNIEKQHHHISSHQIPAWYLGNTTAEKEMYARAKSTLMYLELYKHIEKNDITVQDIKDLYYDNNYPDKHLIVMILWDEDIFLEYMLSIESL